MIPIQLRTTQYGDLLLAYYPITIVKETAVTDETAMHERAIVISHNKILLLPLDKWFRSPACPR